MNNIRISSLENYDSFNMEDAWKYYLTPDELSMEEIGKTMAACYENDSFVLYKRK